MELLDAHVVGLRTTIPEDREGIALLKRTLHEVYESGLEKWPEDESYDEVKLWNDLLAVIGASV